MDRFNLYAYVANDPVNRGDPSGNEGEGIVVTAARKGVDIGLALGRLAGFLASAPVRVLSSLVQSSPAGAYGDSCELCHKNENAEVDVTDADSVEGKTPEEVEEAAKEKGWTERPARDGEGKRFSDASGNNGIRIMKGGGNRGGPDGPMKSGGPYAQIVGGRDAGKYVALAGNRTIGR
jgi:hypothetical protein